MGEGLVKDEKRFMAKSQILGKEDKGQDTESTTRSDKIVQAKPSQLFSKEDLRFANLDVDNEKVETAAGSSEDVDWRKFRGHHVHKRRD